MWRPLHSIPTTLGSWKLAVMWHAEYRTRAYRERHQLQLSFTFGPKLWWKSFLDLLFSISTFTFELVLKTRHLLQILLHIAACKFQVRNIIKKYFALKYLLHWNIYCISKICLVTNIISSLCLHVTCLFVFICTWHCLFISNISFTFPYHYLFVLFRLRVLFLLY